MYKRSQVPHGRWDKECSPLPSAGKKANMNKYFTSVENNTMDIFADNFQKGQEHR